MVLTNDTGRRLGAAALALTGVLHLALAPENMSEQAYIGALFLLGGLTAMPLSVWLATGEEAAPWAFGAMIAGGMAVGFIASRTVGLPGFHESEWEASGVLSVILEAGVVGLAAAALRGNREALPA
jgi:hypothetical protein